MTKFKKLMDFLADYILPVMYFLIGFFAVGNGIREHITDTAVSLFVSGVAGVAAIFVGRLFENAFVVESVPADGYVETDVTSAVDQEPTTLTIGAMLMYADAYEMVDIVKGHRGDLIAIADSLRYNGYVNRRLSDEGRDMANQASNAIMTGLDYDATYAEIDAIRSLAILIREIEWEEAKGGIDIISRELENWHYMQYSLRDG